MSQVSISIGGENNATSLYRKISDVSNIQLFKLSFDLFKGNINFEEQDHSKATYWLKWTRKDGIIDFQKSAGGIHNLVRALVPLHPGAEFAFEQGYIVVQTVLSR